jgi:hypothetical protein
MLSDLAIEGITVDTKNLGRFSLISTRLDECTLDKSLFKFAYCFIQVNSPLDHFRYKGFQLLFHNYFP